MAMAVATALAYAFDAQVMMTQMDSDFEMITAILPDLIEALFTETETLRRALDGGDADAAARAAHTAKGLAGTAGGQSAMILARAIEAAVRNGDPDQATAQLALWEIALRRLADEARDWMAQHV